MAAFNYFFGTLGSDTLKVMLTNTDPASATSLAAITEISAGHGYTTGGSAAAGNAFAGRKLTAGNVVFTASGGGIGPFRYAVLYNATTSQLIGYFDYGSSITVADTFSFTVAWDATNGILTLG